MGFFSGIGKYYDWGSLVAAGGAVAGAAASTGAGASSEDLNTATNLKQLDAPAPVASAAPSPVPAAGEPIATAEQATPSAEAAPADVDTEPLGLDADLAADTDASAPATDAPTPRTDDRYYSRDDIAAKFTNDDGQLVNADGSPMTEAQFETLYKTANSPVERTTLQQRIADRSRVAGAIHSGLTQFGQSGGGALNAKLRTERDEREADKPIEESERRIAQRHFNNI